MEVCVTHLPASAKRLDEYQKAQAVDRVCSSVISYCQEGWPERDNVGADLRPYWKACGELTVDKNNLLLYGKRIVVPKLFQRQTLEKIHAGHQGIEMSTPSQHSSLVARTLSRNREHGEAVPDVRQRLLSLPCSG